MVRPASLVSVEFAERLAALRRAKGLTQAALAERANLSVNQLSRYESGVSEPSLGALRQLAVALSVTSDSLVFADDERIPPDEALRLAFEATNHLDEDEKEAVRKMLSGFLAGHENRKGREGPRTRKSAAT